MENREMEITLSLRDILGILRKRVGLIILITLIASLASGLLSFFVLKPVYEAKISIVVNKGQDSTDKQQLDYNDVMMYQNLIKTYAEIVKSRTVAQKTINTLNLNGATPDSLEKQITVTLQANTQIMDIKVRDKSAVKAKDIVNVLANTFIEESKRIYPDGNIQIIDPAVIPKDPVSPNKKLNVAIAFFLGFMLSLGLAFILEHMDNTIKTEDDVEKYLNIPSIGVIPKSVE